MRRFTMEEVAKAIRAGIADTFNEPKEEHDRIVNYFLDMAMSYAYHVDEKPNPTAEQIRNRTILGELSTAVNVAWPE